MGGRNPVFHRDEAQEPTPLPGPRQVKPATVEGRNVTPPVLKILEVSIGEKFENLNGVNYFEASHF